MGRRSINTTKSGKYMNPTDQARKEARKKELKKNKRQRQLVRAAVLKNKDPGQILEEMEKIDEMEYNVMQPSPLNEKVLRDKRKKLKETFDRVMRLYHTDEPEHWAELKRKEVEYEKKRLKKQQYYESVKHAQSVQIDDIPLPSQASAPCGISFPGLPARMPPPPTALSLPPFAPSAPPGTINKSTEIKQKTINTHIDSKRKDPPGVPPGPPPNLQEMPDLDSDVDEADIVLKEYNPKARFHRKEVTKPNSLQQRMLAISGQNIDEFMKEMENVHKKKEKERESTKKSPLAEDEYPKSDNDDSVSSGMRSRNSSESSDSDSSSSEKRSNRRKSPGTTSSTAPVAIPLPPTHSAATAPHIMLPAPPMPPLAAMPPPMLFRPPPLRPPGNISGYGMRLGAGGPPVSRSSVMSGMPSRMGIRMPPGPPPGMPPRMAHHNLQHKAQQQKDTKGVTTITAKPQIRNLSADVTRFVPSTLRVKREEIRKPNKLRQFAPDTNKPVSEGHKAVTKDDAYLQFMNEMQGLL